MPHIRSGAFHAFGVALATAVLLVSGTGGPAGAARRDLGTEFLWPNDGWASFGAGTTGGSAAAPNQVYTVRTRRDLIAALNNGVYPPPSSTPSDEPKIVYVDGAIASDTAFADRGTLKVTIHHNVFDGVGQRAPRVRFGQVHVFNNYHRVVAGAPYGSSWGVGIESAIYAEQNFFRTESTVQPAQFITVSRGTAITTLGTRHQTVFVNRGVDARAEWNAVNNPDLSGDVGWTPTRYVRIDPASSVPALVDRLAGPFDW